MKFARKFAEKARGATAAPAVSLLRRGFTLLELLVVITIIGILSGLAYSSLIDLILANRAKESAQAMRTFAERALAEAKRMNTVVELSLAGGSMKAVFGEEGEGNGGGELTQPLSDGFSAKDEGSPVPGVAAFETAVKSELLIGTSGIAGPGYFSACGARGYCGAAVKESSKNSFTAYIKKGSNAANWEAL